jgi:flagellar motor switch/type III secretory pathway protein FliN
MAAETLDNSTGSSIPSSAAGGEETMPSLQLRPDSSHTHELPSASLSPDSPLSALPLQLDVTVPIPSFRVRDLLTLDKGAVLESEWPHSEDVPVWCGGVQLVWTEFEVVDEKLAVRVTRVG